jgi:hypothetical protein
MDPKEPVIPDPDAPRQNPSGPVFEPVDPDKPTEYDAGGAGELEGYDEAEAESFPASDPPAATEPGVG